MKGPRHLSSVALILLAIVLLGGMIWGFAMLWHEVNCLRETLASLERTPSAAEPWAAVHRSLKFIDQAMVVGAAAWLVFIAGVAYVIYRADKRRAEMDHQEWLASLGILAASVAHEIRNPLTAINARLFTLRKAVADSPAKTQELDFIGKEINRLELIVREFLQFAKPTELHREPVPPAELLRDVAELLSPELRRFSIALNVAEQTDTRLDGDRQQLRQVLINLTQNAIRSAGKEGRITLRVRDGVLNAVGGDSRAVILEVEDNGKGIPADVQKHLFDPFFTTEKGGTGLGLPIAARIVEKHGGLIQFDTRINQGTTFRVVLPAAHRS